MSTPLPDELLHALQHSRAAVFCHEIVMDAIDLSMAVDRHLLLYGLEGLFLLETEQASWRLPPSRAVWIPAETAFEVGYTNMAAFSTAFRKFTELTPTEYRARF